MWTYIAVGTGILTSLIAFIFSIKAIRNSKNTLKETTEQAGQAEQETQKIQTGQLRRIEPISNKFYCKCFHVLEDGTIFESGGKTYIKYGWGKFSPNAICLETGEEVRIMSDILCLVRVKEE